MKACELLANAWNAIAADLKPEHGWYQRRLPIDKPGEIHTAILHPGNLRRISLLIPRAAIAPLQFPDDSKGFQVQIETSTFPGHYVTAYLRETGTASPELFALVAADLIEHYQMGSSHADCVTRMWRRLLSWKKFFQSVRGGTITREAYVGLFGEMLCLNELLDGGIDSEFSLKIWTGPSGTPQDFTANDTAIEVKTAVGPDRSRVKISSPSQLDDAGLNNLFLFHVTADFRDGQAGIRLSSLIESTINRLGPTSESAANLRDSLLACGLILPDTTPWTNHGFEAIKKELFRVVADFPRLTPSSLPAGVTNVSYEIELLSCHSFRSNISEMVAAINSEVNHARR